VTDDDRVVHLNASRMVRWAKKVGAQEFGFYVVIDGDRIVIPLSLTEDETDPGPEPSPEPETPPL